jgi:hypothetical protein
MDVSRLLRAQGWRHTRAWRDGGRDRDGAPLDDGVIEHMWRRGDAEIWTYTDLGGAMEGFLSFRDDDGSDEVASVHVRFVEKRGFDWLLGIVADLGVLAGVHVYISTACLHGAHETCQIDTFRYDGTYKVAATCKYCGSPCRCQDCHQVTPEEVLTRT